MRFVKLPDGGVEVSWLPGEPRVVSLTKAEWQELVVGLEREMPPPNVYDAMVLTRRVARSRR